MSRRPRRRHAAPEPWKLLVGAGIALLALLFLLSVAVFQPRPGTALPVETTQGG